MKTIVVEHGDHVTIQTTPRRASAILMVLAGATLQQVGDELGVTRQRIGQYVRDAGLAGAVFSNPTPYTGTTTRLATYLGRNSTRSGVGRGRDGARYGPAAKRVHALYRLAGFPEERKGNWTGEWTRRRKGKRT